MNKRTLREGKVTNLCHWRHGLIQYFAHDEYVGKSIELLGEYSESEIALFKDIVDAGDTVLEVGANIGAHTVFFAQRVGATGKVIAFEPQQQVFEVLRSNMVLNELWNVELHPCAAGAQSCQMAMPVFDIEKRVNLGCAALHGLETEFAKQFVHYPSDVITIDSLNLNRLDFLKIDVEGMERDVLIGARETILRLRPILYLENDREDRSQALLETIESLGYNAWWHLALFFNENNYANHKKNEWESGLASINVFCLPKEWNAQVSNLSPIDSPSDNWHRVGIAKSGATSDERSLPAVETSISEAVKTETSVSHEFAKFTAGGKTDSNCLICQGPAMALDVVDFNKNCEEARGLYAPLSGVPVYYHRCADCGFVYAPMFQNWSIQEFSDKIYNDDYIRFDPDYIGRRPLEGANHLHHLFGKNVSTIRQLDYGGGSGILSQRLHELGWNSTSYDPFSTPDLDPASLGKFDLISAFEVFEHVPDPHAMLRQITALLNDNGLLLFSTQLSDNNILPKQRLTWWYASPRNGHISLYSTQSLQLLFEKYGYVFASFSQGLHLACKSVPAWAQHLVNFQDQPPR